MPGEEAHVALVIETSGTDANDIGIADGSDGSDVQFDNLSIVAVPAPASFGLAALGVLGPPAALSDGRRRCA